MLDGLHRIVSTFFDPGLILKALPEVLLVGLPNTLLLSVLASAIGIVLGLLVAAGLLSTRRAVRLPCRGYVDVLRGLPHILTVYLIGQGLPLAGLSIFGGNTYGYAALAIGLIESAYFAEIFAPASRASSAARSRRRAAPACRACRRCATSSLRRGRAACYRR